MGACDMFSAIRFRDMAIAGVLFCAVPCLVHGQSACAQLGVDCSHPNTSGGSSGASGGPADGGPIGLILGIPGDIRRARDKAKESKIAKEGTALNDQGLVFYNSRDWAAAEAHFKECLKYYPNDQVVLRNLALTQGQEGEDAYRKGDFSTALSYFRQALGNDPTDDPEKRVLNDDLSAAQDKIAAANIQQTIRSLAQSLTVAPSPKTTSSPGGLEFSDGGSTSHSDHSGGLEFTDSDPSLKDAPHDTSVQPSAGGSTNAFGINSNPSNPDLDHSAPAHVEVHSALDQASSAANSGAAADTNGRSDDAKAESGCTFNTAACAAYTPVRVEKNVAQTPGAAEVASHISAAGKKDPEIQKDMAFYEKTDGEKIDTKTKLAAIQNKIDSRQGDTQVLNAEKATLSNDLKRYETDETNTQAQIKKRLVSIDVPWVETAAPQATGATAAKP